MKLNINREWLREKILSDPDYCEPSAGQMGEEMSDDERDLIFYVKSARAALLAELAGKMPEKAYPIGNPAAQYADGYNRALADVRAALGLPEVP